MTKDELVALKDISLENFSYLSVIFEKKCWIGEDEYRFKFWMEKDGSYCFYASILSGTLDFNGLMNIRLEMGFVAAEINAWFQKSREPTWDTYLSHDKYGDLEILPFDKESFIIKVSDVYHRQ